MKREIKFRAWTVNEKLMLNGYAGNTLLSGGMNVADYHNSSIEAYAQELILMQFTGFKDIKGVEIYEGDILKRANNKLVEVYWRDEYGCFDGAYINFEGSNILSTYVSDSEVIGNIYQNTELLP